MTDRAIESIIQHCPSVESLDIRGNEKISNQALVKLFDSINTFKTVHLKRRLGVTDEVILMLATSKENLQKLNLRGCYKNFNISNNTVSGLFKDCPNIQALDIAWHSYFNDKSLITLIDNCKNLLSIDLSGCELVSDESMDRMIAKCKNLDKIILFNNYKISQNTIKLLQKKINNVKQY